ncbi:MAG TPA: hypothetical protein VHL08_09745 [Dongiaceae bacterium]|jgi:hypothetical protein|nr:hypothetical protein [Dongiaceae bacterium]
MLDYPNARDLIAGLRKAGVEEEGEKLKILAYLERLVDAADPRTEELAAYRAYLGGAPTLAEARRLLAQDIRRGPLPEGEAGRRLHDLLLACVVPGLRLSNPRHIVLRQKEKRGAESAI